MNANCSSIVRNEEPIRTKAHKRVSRNYCSHLPSPAQLSSAMEYYTQTLPFTVTATANLLVVKAVAK